MYSLLFRCGYVAVVQCISLVVAVDSYSRVMSRYAGLDQADFLVESDVSAELPSKAAGGWNDFTCPALVGSGAALRTLRRASPRWPKLLTKATLLESG